MASTTYKRGTVGEKVCAASFINELGAFEMQIGDTGARKCHGDSGGPTYLEVDAGDSSSLRVIGVTSRAYDESDCLKGGVDTRVDAWLDWIDAEMTGACERGERVWCDVAGILPPSSVATLGGGGGGGARRSSSPEDCSQGAPPSLLAAVLALVLLRRRRRYAAGES